MENEESSSTSSSSFTESRMELDCRLVNLSPLGICDATIPPTWSVTEGSSYSDINKEMNEKIQLSESNLSLLTQKFGPRPCWKFPEMDEMIPPSIKTLYLVDDSKLFLIALLRSVDGDSPIFVDLSHETRQEDRTILNVLESTMTCHNLDPLATNIYSNSDSIDQAMTETIGDRIFDYNSLKLHPKFPTTFYICSVSAPDDFIFKTINNLDAIPLSFKLGLARCERLVNAAVQNTTLPLQCLHISQSLLHLMVNLVDSEQRTMEDLWKYDEICRLADYVANHIEQLTATTLDSENIQRIMKDLNTTFESCCGDFPGAVSVRYSHDIFMNMAQADLRNWKYENIQVTGSKCEENREKISPHVKWTSGKESSISALFQSPNTAKGKRAAQLLTHDQIYSKSGVDTKEEDIGMNLKEKGLQGNINPLGDQEVAWRHPDTNSASHRQALGQAIRGKQEEDSMHQWQQFNVSQPYPSIPRPHVRTLEFRSVKQTRFEVAVSCAIIDTKIIKDAIEVVSPLYPLKGSLGMVITLLEIVKDARRCEEEWELWATSFTDRIGMLHEYITSKQSHFGLHRPVVDYQETLDRVVQNIYPLARKHKIWLQSVISRESDENRIQAAVLEMNEAFNIFMNNLQIMTYRAVGDLREEQLMTSREFMTGLTEFQDNRCVMTEDVQMEQQETKKILSEAEETLLLKSLRTAHLANGDNQDSCMRGTRSQILDEARSWATNESSPQIFWLADVAGAGKSTVAIHLSKEWKSQSQLAGRFFFSRDAEETRTPKYFFSTIAQQGLSHLGRDIRAATLDGIRALSDPVAASLEEQCLELFVRPLERLPSTKILVIDALDECESTSCARLLRVLLPNLSNIPHLKIFLTSRPNGHIVEALAGSQLYRTSLRINLEENNEDISQFMKEKLRLILPGHHIEQLVTRSEGLFIWASTVCKILHRYRGDRVHFVKELLVHGPHQMNLLYEVALQQALPELEEGGNIRAYKNVLSIILGAFEPLSPATINRILGIKNTYEIVKDLGSVLESHHPGDPVRFLHPTFRDFLLLTSTHFHVDEVEAHRIIAQACLDIMARDLRFDMCDIFNPIFDDEITGDSKGIASHNPESLIPRDHILKGHTTHALRYSCRFWGDHLIIQNSEKLPSRYDIVTRLEQFFSANLLDWMYIVSFMNSLKESKAMLGNLVSKLLDEKLRSRTKDSERFLGIHSLRLQSNPLNVYNLLAFGPKSAIFQTICASSTLFSDPIVKLGLEDTWASKITYNTTRPHSRIISKALAGFPPYLTLLWDGVKEKSRVIHLQMYPDGQNLAITQSKYEGPRVGRPFSVRTVLTAALIPPTWNNIAVIDYENTIRICSCDGSFNQVVGRLSSRPYCERMWISSNGEAFAVILQESLTIVKASKRPSQVIRLPGSYVDAMVASDRMSLCVVETYEGLRKRLLRISQLRLFGESLQRTWDFSPCTSSPRMVVPREYANAWEIKGDSPSNIVPLWSCDGKSITPPLLFQREVNWIQYSYRRVFGPPWYARRSDPRFAGGCSAWLDENGQVIVVDMPLLTKSSTRFNSLGVIDNWRHDWLDHCEAIVNHSGQITGEREISTLVIVLDDLRCFEQTFKEIKAYGTFDDALDAFQRGESDDYLGKRLNGIRSTPKLMDMLKDLWSEDHVVRAESVKHVVEEHLRHRILDGLHDMKSNITTNAIDTERAKEELSLCRFVCVRELREQVGPKRGDWEYLLKELEAHDAVIDEK